MPGLHNTFGIAARNFTAHPEMPDARALVEYGVKMEEMGFDSLWVWDHILLGVEPSFPIIDSLTLLTAIAARTKKIKLSTGILVLAVCTKAPPVPSQAGDVPPELDAWFARATAKEPGER